MALCAAVHAATGVLDRQGRDLMRPESACTRGWLGPLPDTELGPGGADSARHAGGAGVASTARVEPPQTERTDRFLRSLQVETGGVGQRHRAISTPHEVWVGRYERTGHEYVHVRPLF